MLHKIYKYLKELYIKEQGYKVPERYQSQFVHWGGGADVQYIYKEWLKSFPKNAKILIVGVMGGRDYFLFKNLGYEVVAVDIGPQLDIEPIVFCNIEEDLPFSDQYFDAVILGEVLEHLREDIRALENIRRVLKPEGKLIVSLPFFNDCEEGHMRIHSPESGKRLLAMGGFSVCDYLERPGFFSLIKLNIFQHSLCLLIYWLTRKIAYFWLTRFAGSYEMKMGHALWLRPIRRLSNHFGGYYLCHKSDNYDHILVNKKLYTSPH